MSLLFSRFYIVVTIHLWQLVMVDESHALDKTHTRDTIDLPHERSDFDCGYIRSHQGWMTLWNATKLN